MNFNQLYKTTAAALLMLVAIAGCSTAKKPKTMASKQPVSIPFSKDTATTTLSMKPAQGRSMTIENLQVYVSSSKQPGVGVAIKRSDNNKSNIILPHIVNGNVYIYGGLINIILRSGDEATIEVAEIETGKLLNARIVVSGTEQ